MTASSWDRSRRVASAASVLTVTAVVIGAVILALTVGVPKTWWPHTGQVFTADTDTRTGRRDPCALVVGPVTAYCERGAAATAAGRPDGAGAAWRLATAGAGMAALVVWRVRHAAGQRRY
ncbi:hypothetical protein [Streptomyces sp. NPDC004008]